MFEQLDFITIPKLAEMLDVPVSTIYRHAANGILPSYQRGERGKIIVEKSAAEDYRRRMQD
jgi:excisionase family DNA binding protein